MSEHPPVNPRWLGTNDQEVPAPEQTKGLHSVDQPTFSSPASNDSTDAPRVSGGPTLILPAPDNWSKKKSLVGLQFGDFELIEELGRGGMGVVFKAHQKSLDRFVAIKMLLAEHFHDPTVLARFQLEARAAAALSHPHIVSIYQVGECIEGRYIVMEYVEGKTLQEFLLRDGRMAALPLVWVLTQMIPVVQAIHYAHTRGIVHRDLKPTNILIHKLKGPVVMDFGIAKVRGQAQGLTDERDILGTPAYMAPELADEQLGEVGPHTDIYALGAILYTLLTGRLTFEADTVLQTIRKVVSPEPVKSLREYRPEVSPQLEQICMKCLNRAPGQRFTSARILATNLARELLRLRTSARPASRPQQVAECPEPAPLPTVSLVSERSGKHIRLTRPSTVIGRGVGCPVLLKSAEVSKHHCCITVESDRVVVEDLDSSNGTTVNGQEIRRAVLRDGDRLGLAGYVFRVQIQESM